ncbi:MAG TPA: T6SS immunity protein Tdi1 domain-containing protein [Kofleriaceae bacterium]|nr:T6SS immunity protein Tdi1 domain-containing protein [Kofleriaceae bacterium]
MVGEEFRKFFGPPQLATGVPLMDLGLERFWFLKDFEREVGGGIFRSGMLSVASRREQVAELDDWRKLMPPGAGHFATNGLGDLFVVTPEGNAILWIETQYAKVSRLDVRAEQFFDWLAQPEQRQKYLAEKLWDLRFADLQPDEVLGFVPALALGGPMDWGNLEKVKLREHLGILAQLLLT